MKRWVLRILVFLLLGAILNVVVACSCALIGGLRTGYSLHTEYDEPGGYYYNWVRGIPTPRGMTPQLLSPIGACQAMRVFGLDAMLTFAHATDGQKTYGTIAIRSGWPLRSLAGEVWHGSASGSGFISPPSERETIAFTAFELPIGEGRYGRVTIPYRILWQGAIGNTAVYALASMGVWATIALIRGHIRRRHSRCVKCGYDLRGDIDAGCPECGWNRRTTEA